MSVVLYVLGAGLLAWSAFIVLREDTFAAMDIAASLAGWGVFAIGLGALTGAVGKLTRTVAARGRREPRPRVLKPQPADVRPARRLSPAAALPPEGAEPPVEDTPAAPTDRLARRIASAPEPPETSEPEIERPIVVRPALGGGFAARLERDIAKADGPAPNREDLEDGRSPDKEGNGRPILPSPPVRLRVDRPDVARPRVERAPTVIIPVMDAPQERNSDEAAAAAPVIEGVDPVPQTLPPAESVEAPVHESHAERVARIRASRKAAPAPPPRSEEVEASEPKSEPAAEAEPTQEPAQQPEPDPATVGPAPPSPEEDVRGTSNVPEWLARARARRAARLKTPDGAAAPQAPAPPLPDAPEAVREPVDEPAAAPTVRPPGPTLIREGEHRGVTYRFYDDQSVEAESAHGVRRFASVDELRATVQSVRGRDDPEPAPDRDPLDAALAELEGPSADVVADPRDRIGGAGRA